MILLTLALAPIFLILLYVYYRDKQEKEPIGILLRTFFAGALSVIPILIVETALDDYWKAKFGGGTTEGATTLRAAAYGAFVVASFTEEFFKFVCLYLFTWRSRHFNQKFDGIVYAVFVSLGFAAVENLLYVADGGAGVGILRSLTAVPGHALFGVAMGYYYSMARFYPEKRFYYIIMTLVVPILLHGFYDFCLMANNGWLLLLFVPFVILMWVIGFRKMRSHANYDASQP